MASKSSASTDAAAIEELLTRGVAEVYPSKEALHAVLRSGKELRVFNGIDPTAPTLHIGHLASLQKLRQFQDLGHDVIMLIGDFTGMIGDPTGKHSARQQLTRAQVLTNARAYRTQASSVLRFTGRSAAKIKRNGSWWNRMTSLRFLELLSLTTAQRLLERDMFQERMKAGAPVGAHELLYPALQGYDSAAMHVDVEIGGTDQTFNMLMGREYVRKLEDREKFVVTVPLLADANGKKIGKSEGNMVELGATPEDLFGQAMALPDGVIVSCFAQCTAVSMETVIRMRDRLAAGENPRDAKMELATEFVRMRYGAQAAERACAAFVRTFQAHEVPEEVAVMSLKQLGLSGSVPLAMLLMKVGFAASVSEARRLIEQGGIKIDGSVFRAPNATFELDGYEKGMLLEKVFLLEKGFLLQKGKRHFMRVVGKK